MGEGRILDRAVTYRLYIATCVSEAGCGMCRSESPDTLLIIIIIIIIIKLATITVETSITAQTSDS